MLVYVTMLACAALMVLFVRRYDLHEKEPWYMLLVAVALGIGVMWVAGRVEDAAFARLRLDTDDFAAKAALVTLVEESGKLLGVLLIALLFRRHFTDALDGLLYGTLAGLGMAIEESLLYLSLTPDKNAQALGAEVVRLFGHSLMGGLLGFAAGLTLRPAPGGPRKVALPATCVGVVLVVHFCWDYIAYRPHVAAAMRGVLMLLMLCLMLVWGAMAAYAMEMSRRLPRAGEAAPDAPAAPAVT
jgi:RsiW-degrading membrane proteinase PrsW (M82 family)